MLAVSGDGFIIVIVLALAIVGAGVIYVAVQNP